MSSCWTLEFWACLKIDIWDEGPNENMTCVSMGIDPHGLSSGVKVRIRNPVQA